jgi:hypothetical protein
MLAYAQNDDERPDNRAEKARFQLEMGQRTTTMERRMKPAAAASLAPLFEYTSELTDDVTSTMPPAV